MNRSHREHRYRAVMVSPELLAQWVTTGAKIHARCLEGVPDDARLVRSGYEGNGPTGRFVLVFEHRSWLDCPDATPLPILAPRFETIKSKADEDAGND